MIVWNPLASLVVDVDLGKLVSEGGRTPLTLVALAIVLVAFLALWFFHKDKVVVRICIFLILLTILVSFGVAYYRFATTPKPPEQTAIAAPAVPDTAEKKAVVTATRTPPNSMMAATPDDSQKFCNDLDFLLTASFSKFQSIKGEQIHQSTGVLDFSVYKSTRTLAGFQNARLREFPFTTQETYFDAESGKLKPTEASDFFKQMQKQVEDCLAETEGWHYGKDESTEGWHSGKDESPNSKVWEKEIRGLVLEVGLRSEESSVTLSVWSLRHY